MINEKVIKARLKWFGCWIAEFLDWVVRMFDGNRSIYRPQKRLIELVKKDMGTFLKHLDSCVRNTGRISATY